MHSGIAELTNFCCILFDTVDDDDDLDFDDDDEETDGDGSSVNLDDFDGTWFPYFCD